MNEALEKEVTEEEVRMAIFQIGATKAPVPNGFSAIFFQSNWNLIKHEFVREVKQFFNGGDHKGTSKPTPASSWRADVRQARNLKSIISSYEEVSGQRVNDSKS
ncbi:hypothetical protein QQ045_005161 [Rhodiola kirilowii]